MYVEPMNTRPNYYVIRVDSSWSKDQMGEHIDDVLSALEEEFGPAYTDAEDPDDFDGDDPDDAEPEERERVHHDFPALNDEVGVSWGRYEWPVKIAPNGAVYVDRDNPAPADASPGETLKAAAAGDVPDQHDLDDAAEEEPEPFSP
jgi:hypothetical protein